VIIHTVLLLGHMISCCTSGNGRQTQTLSSVCTSALAMHLLSHQ